LPKKSVSVEEHLARIEILMAGILLDRRPNVKEIAKVIGVSDNELSRLFPRKKETKEKQSSKQ